LNPDGIYEFVGRTFGVAARTDRTEIQMQVIDIIPPEDNVLNLAAEGKNEAVVILGLAQSYILELNLGLGGGRSQPKKTQDQHSQSENQKFLICDSAPPHIKIIAPPF
jgi:hypothetical protein